MNEHPIHAEDLELYALGALDADEKRAVESHISACPECGGKLADCREIVAWLAFASPPVDPSPRVRERLLAQIHAASANLPAAPARGVPQRPASLISRWWTAVLVPAGVALALLAILLWREDSRLDQQLAAQRAAIAQMQKQLAEAREISELVEASDTMKVSLASMPGMPQGTARVFFNSQMGKLMCDGAIAPAPKNMTYQLWLVPKQGAPISAGFFDATAGEHSSWMAAVPKGVVPVVFAVTIEPAGGMPHPTGPKVLVGPVS